MKLKSMLNFDNASLIFVGAVVIILIILAVFYLIKNKNIESFISKKGRKLTPKEVTKKGMSIMSRKIK